MRSSRVALAAAFAASAVALTTFHIIPSAGAETEASPRATVDWQPCTEAQLEGFQCAEVKAPLDPERPRRGEVTLAVSRLPAAGGADERTGTLVVHPGGPGATGRELLSGLAAGTPDKVKQAYDIVTYDPRGVGASTPRLGCDTDYWKAPWADPVPAGPADEAKLRRKATGYAVDCARGSGGLLKHMSTRHQVADIEALRSALGEKQISFAGYGYGGYVGAAWAGLHPGSRDRLILDSTMRPDADIYRHYLDQDLAMDELMDEFYAWAAEHNDVYGLGTKATEVEEHYWSLRKKVSKEPAGGTAGPYELEAAFINATWDDRFWPVMADVLTQYAATGATDLVAQAYEQFAQEPDDNRYASFLATSCTDGTWSRNWSRWHRDKTAMHAKAPFIAWNNAWHLSPCARWSQPDGRAVQIDGDRVGEALLLHATKGGGMPYKGGLAMHERLPGSRLVVEDGGVNHALSLTRGNACADAAVTDYLLDGKLPADAGKGPDQVCPRSPAPAPPAAEAGSAAPKALARPAAAVTP